MYRYTPSGRVISSSSLYITRVLPDVWVVRQFLVVFVVRRLFPHCNMTHSCVDFMDVTMGDVPVRHVRPFQVGQRVAIWSVARNHSGYLNLEPQADT